MKNHTKKVGLFTLISLIWILLAMPAAAGDAYNVDSDHTYLLFRVKHLGIGYSYGRFSKPTGTFTFDEAKDTIGAIDMQILATNVDTDVEKRDNHLKSPDFFDAKKFPMISFKGTSFKKIAENTYEIIGDITLLGKTRPVSLKAIQTGAAKDPWGKYRRAFEAEFTIKRSDFGMDFLMNVAADEVELTVSVEGIRQ